MGFRSLFGAVAVSGASLLAVMPEQLAAQTVEPSLADALAGSLGEERFYYNRATNTAIKQKCTLVDPTIIECDVHAVAATAKLEIHQMDTYRLGEDGRISVQTQNKGFDPISKSSTRDYNSYKKSAAEITLESSSVLAKPVGPEAMILQNNIGYVTGKHGEIMVSSVMPVSQTHGFSVSYEYNQNTGHVLATVVSSIVWKGNLVTAVGASTAQRDYDQQYDHDRFDPMMERLQASDFKGAVFAR